ncbi:kinase-like domain-containing protein [Peziza echinospora]|nr:kinase-like domain-containing protein [Peziza echinospora]
MAKPDFQPYKLQYSKLPCRVVEDPAAKFPSATDVSFKLAYCAERFARGVVPDLGFCELGLEPDLGDDEYDEEEVKEPVSANVLGPEDYDDDADGYYDEDGNYYYYDDEPLPVESNDEETNGAKTSGVAEPATAPFDGTQEYDTLSHDAIYSVEGHSVDLGDLTVVKEIHDTCSLVHLTSQARNPTHYVLKTVNDVNEIRSMVKELLLLSTMPRHRNVMERPAYIVTAEFCDEMEPVVIGFMMRYIPSGSMSSYLNARLRPPPSSTRAMRPLPGHVKTSWSIQLLEGVIFLHRVAGISHAGIKPDNILVEETATSDTEGGGNSQLYLIDFEQIGTWALYRPPEIEGPKACWHYIEESTLESERVDVYAVGAIIWLLFEDVPSPERAATERPELVRTPRVLWDILQRCVDPEPAKRPRLEEVLEAVKGIQRDQLERPQPRYIAPRRLAGYVKSG